MSTLLSINTYYYERGGAEVVFLGHNKLLEGVGWKVIPFAMRHALNLETKWSQHFVEEIEFDQPYSLPGKIVRAARVVYSFEARRKLAKLLDNVVPDICHVHNIYHHISPSILGMLKSRGVPTVLTLHDLKIACPAYKMFTHDGICERCKGGRFYNVVRHRCIKQSITLSAVVMAESTLHRWLGTYRNNVDRFVVPSRFYLEKMVQWGWDRSRFVHIPNFVDVTEFRPNSKVGKPFLYFGRLAEEKGIATLIRAAGVAKVPLQIAGIGPQERLLRQLATDLEVEVRFLGYLSGSALHQAVCSARAVVLPSEWYENAPVSLMESYALGKTVIAANIGGIPELVRPGETGSTFETGSAESLASVLRSFADLPTARIAEMGRAGRIWMENEYTAERYRERILALYKKMGVTC